MYHVSPVPVEKPSKDEWMYRILVTIIFISWLILVPGRYVLTMFLEPTLFSNINIQILGIERPVMYAFLWIIAFGFVIRSLIAYWRWKWLVLLLLLTFSISLHIKNQAPKQVKFEPIPCGCSLQ